jgi:hexosaminidase
MEKKLSIIPAPVSIKYTGGTFQSKGLPSITADSAFSKEMEAVRVQLRGDFDRMGYSGGESGKLVLCDTTGLENSNGEAYRLDITKANITIKASSTAGAYHGLQTLRQLFLSEFKDGEICLPCAEITDYPRFSWRGMMLDCSRYFYSVPFIKNLIDVLSLHHINRFHWHLTDDQGWRLPVEKYPLLTEIGSRRKLTRLMRQPYTGGFYSEDEIREVVDFAASRHIEIIPEVDLPGHASAILASYPGLGCTGGPYRVEDRYGIMEDVLCAGNDQIFDLSARVFDVLAGLFPSKWVHIGGDEVLPKRWNECPKCQKRLAELGLEKAAELQSWITQKLVQQLAERGKTAIGWDEVLEDSDKFKLPKDTVVMSWRGEEGGIRASAQGHKVIMSPNTCGCYLDYKHINLPEEPGQLFGGNASVFTAYSMDPITPAMSEESASFILGGQCNLWAELIYAGKIAEYMIFPRLCALAEAVWTAKENKNFDDFAQRLGVHRLRLDLLGVNQYRGALR